MWDMEWGIAMRYGYRICVWKRDMGTESLGDQSRSEESDRLSEWLRFYILATFEVISRRVPTCENAHSFVAF